MTTFGFEAEFHDNVAPLMAGLHARGLTATDEMHSYHCRCEMCDFETGGVFRGQHDSSCGGEVISHVFSTDNMDEAVSAMTSLQAVAVDVDAEPSLAAGFHVHIGNAEFGRDRYALADAMWAYLRWEGWLGTVASGRWPEVRGFNVSNRSILSGCGAYEAGEAGWGSDEWGESGFTFNGPDCIQQAEEEFSDAGLAQVKRFAYHWIGGDEERHLWLNLQTRNRKTWEFRLWNSTRVAWRMELFSRLSALFLNKDAAPELLATTPNDKAMLSIAGSLDSELAGLLERQLACARTREPFTTVPG